MGEWNKVKEHFVKVQSQIYTFTGGRDSKQYKDAHRQLTLANECCMVLQKKLKGQLKEDCQKMREDINTILIDILDAKSALFEMLLFKSDLDDFQRECKNFQRSEDQSQYIRLVDVIYQKLALFDDIKKHKDLEIPKELFAVNLCLKDCLNILHKKGKQ